MGCKVVIDDEIECGACARFLVRLLWTVCLVCRRLAFLSVVRYLVGGRQSVDGDLQRVVDANTRR